MRKVATFFNVTGGIAGMSLILASVVLLASVPGRDDKFLTISIAFLFFMLGWAAGLDNRFRKTRIVLGIVFALFVCVAVITLLIFPVMYKF